MPRAMPPAPARAPLRLHPARRGRAGGAGWAGRRGAVGFGRSLPPWPRLPPPRSPAARHWGAAPRRYRFKWWPVLPASRPLHRPARRRCAGCGRTARARAGDRDGGDGDGGGDGTGRRTRPFHRGSGGRYRWRGDQPDPDGAGDGENRGSPASWGRLRSKAAGSRSWVRGVRGCPRLGSTRERCLPGETPLCPTGASTSSAFSSSASSSWRGRGQRAPPASGARQCGRGQRGELGVATGTAAGAGGQSLPPERGSILASLWHQNRVIRLLDIEKRSSSPLRWIPMEPVRRRRSLDVTPYSQN